MPDFPACGAGAGWCLERSYHHLPDLFYRRTNPSPVSHPRVVLFNAALARTLGLNPDFPDADRNALFSGNMLPEGSDPIAQAYAGHQFGRFTSLGDGRAILLGEQITSQGLRFDIQLKGAGLTPFSRGGDGRAALGPMLREYIISEAMHALAIPTTRSLAVTTTGESVFRGRQLQGAILTRVAASHIRAGTFEWASARGDGASLQALADYTIGRHYPEFSALEHPYPAFLEAVIGRQADLIAQWLQTGFIHGVMNTDNMALSGETIDYGPCAFMDTYDPATVFSSIDTQGRYAYANQPDIAQWNLARFAETLLPLLHRDEDEALATAKVAIQNFPVRYKQVYFAGMGRKLGLFHVSDSDTGLVQDLLHLLLEHRLDYTNAFRDLTMGASLGPALSQHAHAGLWHERWQQRRLDQPETPEESQQLMRRSNPAFIPRNHLVEAAIHAAEQDGNFALTHKLLEVLAHPFDYDQKLPKYQTPDRPEAVPYQTFCGT